jgi:hypothetical protein
MFRPWPACFAAALFTSALVGCGGGGDAASPATITSRVDAYVGNWLSRSCDPSGSGSSKNLVTITKVSDSQFRVVFNGMNYTSTDCTGAGTAGTTLGTSDIFTLTGTKMLDGLVVDKATRKNYSATFKTVFYTDGRVWREGDDDSPVDADGYPTAFETAAYSIYDKQ